MEIANSAGPSCQTGCAPGEVSVPGHLEARPPALGSSKYECVQAATEKPSPFALQITFHLLTLTSKVSYSTKEKTLGLLESGLAAEMKRWVLSPLGGVRKGEG